MPKSKSVMTDNQHAVHLKSWQQDASFTCIVVVKQETYRLSVYHVLKWDEAQGSHGVAPLDIGSNKKDTLDNANMSSPFRPGNQSVYMFFVGKFSVQHLKTQRIASIQPEGLQQKRKIGSCIKVSKSVCRRYMINQTPLVCKKCPLPLWN